MSKQERYSEILLLEKMLQEGSIEHNRHDLYDGFQIILPLPGQTKEISIIEHAGSYGSVMNLLEIWAEGEIKGFLSAEQTLRIIKNIRERERENPRINQHKKERKGEKCNAGNQIEMVLQTLIRTGSRVFVISSASSTG